MMNNQIQMQILFYFRDRNPEKATTFEQEGFRVFNRAEVNKIANDKLRTFELATLLGVPAVPTKKIRIYR